MDVELRRAQHDRSQRSRRRWGLWVRSPHLLRRLVLASTGPHHVASSWRQLRLRVDEYERYHPPASAAALAAALATLATTLTATATVAAGTALAAAVALAAALATALAALAASVATVAALAALAAIAAITALATA